MLEWLTTDELTKRVSIFERLYVNLYAMQVVDANKISFGGFDILVNTMYFTLEGLYAFVCVEAKYRHDSDELESELFYFLFDDNTRKAFLKVIYLGDGDDQHGRKKIRFKHYGI